MVTYTWSKYHQGCCLTPNNDTQHLWG